LLLSRQQRNGGAGPSIILGAALEAIIRRVGQQQAVAVHANLVLRDDIFLFLVKPLAREVGVFVDVSLDLVKDRLC